MKKLFPLLLLIIPLCLAGKIKHKQCEWPIELTRNPSLTPHPPQGADGYVEYVDVPGCDYKKCLLKNGTEIVATVKLKLPWDADTLTLSGYGKWGFFSSEFTFPDKNLCNSVTPLKCPLKKDQYTEANIRMIINVPYTGITPYVTIEAWDHKGKKAFCVRVEIKIVKWYWWIQR